MTETIGAKIPEELAERIDEYKGEDESTSAAVRRLLRRGLEAEEDPRKIPAWGVAFTLSFAGFTTAFGELDPVVGYFSIVVMVVSLVGGSGVIDRFR
jgi:hypothetical protein